ncbi:MAG: histidinol-phosphate transaminase [Cyanobacteria bacterium P01_D01_bin.105]
MPIEPFEDQPFFRRAINRMQGYAPGEWPELDAGVIKLNSNENPYPPSPQVLQALTQITPECLRRYPDPLATSFRHTVSTTFDISPESVIVGNGSDDLLTLLVRACAEGTRQIAYPMPTYVLYRTLAAIQDAKIAEIPYLKKVDEWHLPIHQLLTEQAAITFVATPNSPTGHVVPMADLRRLAQGLSGVLVIDEAYVDFAGDNADRASIALVREFENVLLLRTVSKGYALAGLRLGFGIAQPTLLSGLLKVKDSYNVDAITLTLGAAAIQDRAYKQKIVRQVVEAREQLATALRELGFWVGRSQTNFLLAQPPGNTPKETSQTLYKNLKKQQIMIRYFSQPGLDNKLRITVGTPTQNQRMINAIKQCLLNE